MVNQRSWQTRIQLLLDNLTIVEVPPDATFKGEFEDLLHAFAAERAKGEEREDILQGVAVWAETRVYFQIKDLKKHLSVNDFNHYTSNKITLRLQDLQAEKMFWRVRGKVFMFGHCHKTILKQMIQKCHYLSYLLKTT